jgi:hypothetical protein
MSNMASCIGELSVLCTKNADMLLYTTNIGIAYKCCLHGKQEPIFAARKVFDLPPKSFHICKVCDQIYDHRKLITNLKFAED